MNAQDAFNIIVLLLAWSAHARISGIEKRSKQ